MAKQDVKVELSYGGSWHDITFEEDVYTRDPIEITRGRADEVGSTPPAAASMTLDNRDGTYNPRDPVSPLFGIARNMPARISVGSDVRFAGEVTSWTPRRAIKGDAWTDTRMAGPLRRLSQGSPAVRSAADWTVFGAGAATAPAAYWPMVGVGALTSGSPAMKVADITGSSAPDLSWMTDASVAPLGEVFTTGGRDIYVRPTAALSPTTSPVVTDVAMRARPTSNTSAFTLSHRSGDFFCNVTGNWVTGVPTLTLVTSSGTLDTASASDAARAWDESAHAWRIALTQDGADIDIVVHLDGTEIMSATHAGATLVDGFLPGLISAGRAECVLGPLVVWMGSAAAVADVHDAMRGYPGETTGNRFLRLCDEAGIVGTVVGDADDTPEMGPQQPDTLANLLREVEATDDGFVYDDRDTVGLEMRTGRSCWNQDAVLTLNYDAFEVAPPTDPVIDDLDVRNDVTAVRRGGGTARAVRESGPLNVQDPSDDEEGVGRYTQQVDVNPFSDHVVGNWAGWCLHRGTVDETRWPTVTVDLDATPGVDVESIEIGDRLTITNMPAELTPDTVSLIVLGWSEHVGSHRRRITFTCAPESPLHVAEVEHADYSFVGSDGSTVNTAFSAGTGTSLSVAIAAGYPLWDDADGPFDILVSGVRLRVTAIAGASSPQTFTVQAAPINGVTKTIAVGERVDLFYPSYIGL